MPETINPKALVEIEGNLIEFVYDSGILRGIKVHRPMGLTQQSHKLVCEEIEANLPINARLNQLEPEFIGGVHVKSWEVEYDKLS